MKKLLLILLFTFVYNTQAQTTYTFNGTVSDDWFDAANWDVNGTPSTYWDDNGYPSTSSSSVNDVIVINSSLYLYDDYVAELIGDGTIILNADLAVSNSSNIATAFYVYVQYGKIVLNNGSLYVNGISTDVGSPEPEFFIYNTIIEGTGNVVLTTGSNCNAQGKMQNVTISPGTNTTKGEIYLDILGVQNTNFIVDIFDEPSTDNYDKISLGDRLLAIGDVPTVTVVTNSYVPNANDVFTAFNRNVFFSAAENFGITDFSPQNSNFIPVIDLVDNTSNGTITITDNQAPTILNCPSNQIVDASSGLFFALPDYVSSLTATDNATPSAITFTQDPLPGLGAVDGTVVTLTATDASGNASSCSFTLTVTAETLTTAAPENVANNMRIYPNPTHGSFTLENESRRLLKYAEVLDIRGALVHKINLETTNVSKLITLNDLASGIYLFKVYTTEGFVTKKLIVE